MEDKGWQFWVKIKTTTYRMEVEQTFLTQPALRAGWVFQKKVF